MSGKTVNKRELAEIMGVSQRTVTDWQNRGMPVALFADRRGLENQYNTAAVIEWRLQQLLAGEKRESSKERLERLQGDRLELELLRECASLVEDLGSRQLLDHAVLAARSVLLNMASRLKGTIDARYGIDLDPALVTAQVDEALRRLSEYQAPADGEDMDGADLLPAALAADSGAKREDEGGDEE